MIMATCKAQLHPSGQFRHCADIPYWIQPSIGRPAVLAGPAAGIYSERVSDVGRSASEWVFLKDCADETVANDA
jgi:hypothetical protein